MRYIGKCDAFGKKVPKPKKEKPPKVKKKIGRPKNPNTKSREKTLFIAQPPKEPPKNTAMIRPDSIKRLIGRPKKIYTPEELEQRADRERRRVETTKIKRSAVYVQPWCESVLKFRRKVDEYFDTGAHTYTIKKGDEEITQQIYTWTGLAFYLEFSSRPSMIAFGKKNPDFKEILEKALLRVEMGYEEKLHGTNPTGAIFALKNSIYGWSDIAKSELNVNVNVFEKLLKSAGKRQLPENITMVEDG